MKEIKVGDVLVWKELRGTVTSVGPCGSALVRFDGSPYPNGISPGTLALATVEEKTLTGDEAKKLWADGAELEVRHSDGQWRPLSDLYTLGIFSNPDREFMVKR